jgi:toxin ParE1/3/4
MHPIRILAEAAEEAMEAAAWYESERQGLGQAFIRAVDHALDLLQDEIVPLISIPGFDNARVGRLILRRFPYDIVLTTHGDEIVVIAFAHHSRRPGFWRDRLLTPK